MRRTSLSMTPIQPRPGQMWGSRHGRRRLTNRRWFDCLDVCIRNYGTKRSASLAASNSMCNWYVLDPHSLSRPQDREIGDASAVQLPLRENPVPHGIQGAVDGNGAESQGQGDDAEQELHHPADEADEEDAEHLRGGTNYTVDTLMKGKIRARIALDIVADAASTGRYTSKPLNFHNFGHKDLSHPNRK